MGIPRSSVTTNFNIASLYKEFNDFEEAKYYLKKGIETSVNTDYKDDLGSLYGSMGGLSIKEGKIDSSIYYFKKADEVYQRYGIPSYEGAESNSIYFKSYIDIYEGNLKEGINNLKLLSKKKY